MKLGSLCTGYGGLDMAAHALFPDADLAFVSDNDTHVSRFLATRFPDAPNLGDFTRLDALPDCDILTAGFPCQPVSHAGKRKGTDDDRWLWDDIERVLGGMVRPPGLLLLENVRGLLAANGGDAMGRVVEGLARLGYVGRYRVLAASAVGAPHRRERVFIVARRGEGPRRPAKRSQEATSVAGREAIGVGAFGPYAAAVARWEDILGRPAPEPTAANADSQRARRHLAAIQGTAGTTSPTEQPDHEPGMAARSAGRRLNPRFVEWMMGLPDGWVTGLDLPRTAQLKMLGNGVVPQQALAAYRSLL